MTAADTSAVAPPSTHFPDAAGFQVSRIRALRGPNYWRLAPVVACDVRQGPFEGLRTSDIPDFTSRLLREVPSLAEHTCSSGGEEGRFVDRVTEGTSLPHVLEHLTLELQTLGGTFVSFGRVARSGDPDVWWVIVAYEEEELGVESMRGAVDLLEAILRGEPFDTPELITSLQDVFEESRLGPSTACIVDRSGATVS